MDVDGALPASGADDDDDDDAPGFYLDEGTVTAAEQPAALEDSDADEASKANQLAARLLSSAKTDDSEADEPLDESLVDTGASTLADPVINKEADAAWHDDDVLKVSLNRQNRTKKLRTSYADDMLSIQEYELRLRRQFHTMSAAKMGSTQGLGWANVDKRAAGKLGDATSKLLLSGNKKASTGLADLERVSIPSDRVDIQRLRDATISSPHNSIITSVKFHPNPQVPIMMTSGLDKTVKLFHIDAKDNPKLSSYRFKDLAPTCTSFAQQGKTAFITGEHRFFYTFNVETETMDICNQLSSSNYDYMFNNSKGIARHWANPSGSHVAMSANNLNGHLMFVSCRDRTLDYTLKMNGKASQVWFEQDGYTLWSAGHDAFMYQWDLRQRRCVGQWMDEGQQRSMSMAGSNDGRYLAVGSRSGVVNLYNRPALAASALAASDQAGKPKPVKTFMQLTTRLDSLCVHPGSQIMAMASRSRLDSLRLVHLPTQTVFSNWPTGSTPLHYVQCLDFSPNGGYLGVGNDRGRVLLFRLNAYTRSI
ncbi:hypothetical protein CXG81DRAFT_9538 [Caulochytrium protostelioides]|uniref:WD40 repeat-like protein n=1 Tax=Caulochytrium protostelioides TaxID=1555241 RepID=A0A4P9WZS3_9FUNG|nr:WD40 repeat-like protein [Caulochytrium protostelioides]RKP03454.1 hypothetical protein CXG81DRAFT_9538 [Caulochytrium protostelioides]|eukprot:RKP03454.1 hypothetical protein CXG81DRAFT_9538 [Caulochytrium protostelioides]